MWITLCNINGLTDRDCPHVNGYGELMQRVNYRQVYQSNTDVYGSSIRVALPLQVADGQNTLILTDYNPEGSDLVKPQGATAYRVRSYRRTESAVWIEADLWGALTAELGAPSAVVETSAMTLSPLQIGALIDGGPTPAVGKVVAKSVASIAPTDGVIVLTSSVQYIGSITGSTSAAGIVTVPVTARGYDGESLVGSPAVWLISSKRTDNSDGDLAWTLSLLWMLYDNLPPETRSTIYRVQVVPAVLADKLITGSLIGDAWRVFDFPLIGGGAGGELWGRRVVRVNPYVMYQGSINDASVCELAPVAQASLWVRHAGGEVLRVPIDYPSNKTVTIGAAVNQGLEMYVETSARGATHRAAINIPELPIIGDGRTEWAEDHASEVLAGNVNATVGAIGSIAAGVGAFASGQYIAGGTLAVGGATSLYSQLTTGGRDRARAVGSASATPGGTATALNDGRTPWLQVGVDNLTTNGIEVLDRIYQRNGVPYNDVLTFTGAPSLTRSRYMHVRGSGTLTYGLGPIRPHYASTADVQEAFSAELAAGVTYWAGAIGDYSTNPA